MTLNLTPEQTQALQAGEPLRLADPSNNTVYVLVPEESFRRVQALFADGPLTEEERRVVLKGVWERAGWDDPIWDEYARLIPEGSPK